MDTSSELVKDSLKLISRETIFLNEFNNKTILISGATGLLGRHLVSFFHLYDSLGTKGIKLICLVRNLSKARSIFGDEFNNIEFYESDVRKKISINEPIDFIFHTASITDSAQMTQFPVETLDVLYTGTKNILELAKAHRSALIYVSSMEAFGVTNPHLTQVSENDLGYIDLTNPRSVYPEGKRICELMVLAYAKQYHMHAFNIRLAQTFGAGVSKQDNRVFADFARKALNDLPLIINSSGKSIGNYIDLDDAISAMITVLNRGESGETYTAVNEESTMSIYNLAKFVANKLSNGRSSVQIRQDDEISKKFAPDTSMHLSSHKLRELGWLPKYSLDDMFSKMTNSWRE